MMLLFALFAAFAAASDVAEDGVLVLDGSNFDQALAAHPKLLVKFYAPWCGGPRSLSHLTPAGHCMHMAPEFAKAAAALKDSGAVLAKVNADQHQEFLGRFNIMGYPTLKWFESGSGSDYSGGRTEKDITAWVMGKLE
jgi:protein disulfide-isomerase A1